MLRHQIVSSKLFDIFWRNLSSKISAQSLSYEIILCKSTSKSSEPRRIIKVECPMKIYVTHGNWDSRVTISLSKVLCNSSNFFSSKFLAQICLRSLMKLAKKKVNLNFGAKCSRFICRLMCNEFLMIKWFRCMQSWQDDHRTFRLNLLLVYIPYSITFLTH